MRVDVYLTVAEIAPSALNGAVVAVIDVLRASTSIAVALANGARAVIPFEGADEVADGARQFERRDVILAGERKMFPVSGFDLGNSPQAFTREAVEGKTLLLSTTNGTHALLAVQGAREVVVASFVNCSAVASMLRSALHDDINVAIVCAGQDRHFALEDAGCAGRLVDALSKEATKLEMNDAAHVCALLHQKYAADVPALFRDAVHGRALEAAGFGLDLEVCARVDAYPVIPRYAERQIVAVAPGFAE